MALAAALAILVLAGAFSAEAVTLQDYRAPTVVTVDSETSFGWTSAGQRRQWFASNLWWTFYMRSTETAGHQIWVYKTSPDGVTWSTCHAVWEGSGSVSSMTVAVTFSGSLFHFIVNDMTAHPYKLVYRAAAPQSNGALEFVTDWQVVKANAEIPGSAVAVNIFSDSQGKPWITYRDAAALNETHQRVEFLVDHSTSSNGYWRPQGGIFPYSLETLTLDNSVVQAAATQLPQMIAYTDGTVQFFHGCGARPSFPSGAHFSGTSLKSYVFNDMSILSQFDTGLIPWFYTERHQALLTLDGRAFYYGEFDLEPFLLEFNKQALVRKTAVPPGGDPHEYGWAFTYSADLDCLMLMRWAGSPLSPSIDFKLYDLASNTLSAPFPVVADPQLKDIEWAESFMLSPAPDNQGNFLFTYLGGFPLCYYQAALINLGSGPQATPTITPYSSQPTPMPQQNPTFLNLTSTQILILLAVVACYAVIIAKARTGRKGRK